MSLTLNGTTQYATAARSLAAWPVWIAAWVKPTSVGVGSFLGELGNTGNANRMAMHFNTSVLNCNVVAGAPDNCQVAGLVAGSWQFVFVQNASNTSRKAWMVAGVQNSVVDVLSLPVSVNIFTLGARNEPAAPDLFYGGKVAHVAIGASILTDAQLAAFGAGANPGLMPGVTNYWPLISDYSPRVGVASLSPTGGPSFATTDNPVVQSAANQLSNRVMGRAFGRLLARNLPEDYPYG